MFICFYTMANFSRVLNFSPVVVWYGFLSSEEAPLSNCREEEHERAAINDWNYFLININNLQYLNADSS